jgi:hypothetical protein
MYAKYGSVADAWRVSNKMPSQNVVSWNAILGGCAKHRCNGKEDLKHLECIFEDDVQANDITYFCDLPAVSQTDFVDKGMCYCASVIIAFGFAFGI